MSSPDSAGRLYALMLTAGQVHDIHGGPALLANVPPMRELIADKAYDGNDFRDLRARQGTEAVISPVPRRLTRRPFDIRLSRAQPDRTGVLPP